MIYGLELLCVVLFGALCVCAGILWHVVGLWRDEMREHRYTERRRACARQYCADYRDYLRDTGQLETASEVITARRKLRAEAVRNATPEERAQAFGAACQQTEDVT